MSDASLYRGYESGEFGEDEFHRRVEKLIERPIPFETLRELWFSIFLPDPLVPEDMVRAIRTRYRTVLLSNTNPSHYAMLRERYRVLDHFDAYVLSHEVRAMKPSPKIYAAALAAADCEPGECFFTDDVAEFVEGARRAGIDAVQFQSVEQVSAELRARGVTW